MHVKKGCKDLKRYPQISRRVRDTLARLLAKCILPPWRDETDWRCSWCPLLCWRAPSPARRGPLSRFSAAMDEQFLAPDDAEPDEQAANPAAASDDAPPGDFDKPAQSRNALACDPANPAIPTTASGAGAGGQLGLLLAAATFVLLVGVFDEKLFGGGPAAADLAVFPAQLPDETLRLVAVAMLAIACLLILGAGFKKKSSAVLVDLIFERYHSSTLAIVSSSSFYLRWASPQIPPAHARVPRLPPPPAFARPLTASLSRPQRLVFHGEHSADEAGVGRPLPRHLLRPAVGDRPSNDDLHGFRRHGRPDHPLRREILAHLADQLHLAEARKAQRRYPHPQSADLRPQRPPALQRPAVLHDGLHAPAVLPRGAR